MGRIYLITTIPFALGIAGCDALTPNAPAEEEVLDGFIDALTPAQARSHIVGDEEFARIFSAADGLGPIFVAASCDPCHVGDGKGRPTFNLKRFGRMTSSGFDAMAELGGPQLQNRSIPGYPAETIPTRATGVAAFNPPAVTGLATSTHSMIKLSSTWRIPTTLSAD